MPKTTTICCIHANRLAALILLVEIATCSTVLSADKAQISRIDWSEIDREQAVMGRIVQKDDLRYLYFSLNQHIYVRSGRFVDGKWKYRKAEPALRAGLPEVSVAYDGNRCEFPSVAEGRFKVRRGTKSIAFKYVMTYTGQSYEKRWHTLFAVSNSLAGPWIKLGPLLENSLPRGTETKQCTVLSERGGIVRLFYSVSRDGIWTRMTCRANLSSLTEPDFHHSESVTQKGLVTKDGQPDPLTSLGVFAVGPNDTFLLARNVAAKPAVQTELYNRQIGVSAIAQKSLTTAGAAWSKQITLDAQNLSSPWIGMCGFILDPSGRAITDQKGRIQLLVTFQKDRNGEADDGSGRIHECHVAVNLPK